MTMTGHKTALVFERYNITDDSDKQRAFDAMTAYRKDRTDRAGGSSVVEIPRAAADAD